MSAAARIEQVYREKGLAEIGRRVAWHVLSLPGQALLRMAERFSPDYSLSLTREDRDHLARNAELKGLHAGRRCFVIGNGPSARREELAPLANEITFVMNGFDHPALDRWRPTYQCLSDPAYFDPAHALQLFRTHVRRVSAATVVAPIRFRCAIEQYGELPGDRVRYVHFRGELKDVRELDMTGSLPGVWIVSELCLMVALYAGCSPIYLLGLDHDWFARPPHREDWDAYSYKFILEFGHKIWCGYEALRDLAGRMGTVIENATKGTYLDVFPRVDYQSLVAPRGRSGPLPHDAAS